MKQQIKDSIPKIKEFISNLPFLKKKEPPPPEFVTPNEWKPEKERVVEAEETVIVTKPPLPTFKFWRFSIPYKPIPIPIPKVTYRIPHFLKVKRIIAEILFVVNGLMVIFSFAESPLLVLFFLPNTFILLDYIVKSKKKKQKQWHEGIEDVDE